MRLIIVFFLGAFVNCYSQDNSRYINPDSLSWKDFKGKCNYSVNFMANTYAIMKESFVINKDSTISAKVWVVFLYDSSYVKEELFHESPKRQQYLFNHEKNHYLISIIVAKNVKKYLFENPKVTINELNKLIQEFSNSLQSLQSKYDSDTNHSTNQDAQKQWDDKIKISYSELSSIQLDLPQ